MGRSIAGGVLQVYTKTSPIAVGEVCFGQSNVPVFTNRAPAELIPQAEARIRAYYEGGLMEFPGMERTTVLYEAVRMAHWKNGPDVFELHASAVAFGDVAFAGFPGEPFTDMGRGVKNRSPFTLTIPCCVTNGYQDYFPIRSAYDEGGYEARSAWFKAGTAETLVDASVALLETLK